MTGDPVRTLESIVAYDGSHFRVNDDEVEFRGGRVGRHMRVAPQTEGVGAVAIVVSGDRLALVRTYRYPIASYQWGFPRGFGHSPDPVETAGAEIKEELGLTVGTAEVLGYITPDSGILTNRVAVVIAVVDGPTPELEPEDDEEVLEARWWTIAELTSAISDGSIEDAFTLASLALALARGRLRPPRTSLVDGSQ